MVVGAAPPVGQKCAVDRNKKWRAGSFPAGMFPQFTRSCAFIALLLCLQSGVCSAMESRAESAKVALAKAAAFMRSISTEGGYVYLYTQDLARRTAERPATATQIAVQPPGTPAMGMAFLQAYHATGDKVHLEAAREAALALAKCRLEKSGGWHATADFDPARPNVDGKLYGGEKYKFGQIIKHTISTAFDDDATQGAVRFLITYVNATTKSGDPEDARIRRALDAALQGMIRAQYPNGAWPQCYRGEPRDEKDYPVKKATIPSDYPMKWPDADYTGYYTLNDNCHADCVRVMLQAWRVLQKPECMESARRGADFLLLAQLPEPQPGWAQQYDIEMHPAWARVHEGPSVSSCESGGAVDALLDVYLETGESKYLDAAGSAVAWLRRCSVGGRNWWRLYELGGDRPVFGDDSGRILHSLKEVTAKYATGYVWKSNFGITETLARFDRIKTEGREAVNKATRPMPDLKELEARADEAIAALDGKGRWMAQERWRKGAPPEPSISTKTFIRNVTVLSDYLLVQRGEVPPPKSSKR